MTAHNTKFASFMFGFLLIVSLTASAVVSFTIRPAWMQVVDTIGGEFVQVDEAQRPCAFYEHDQQLICYNVLDTWYGQDAVPAYVIESGIHTPLYN
jgi:hypothetical protein